MKNRWRFHVNAMATISKNGAVRKIGMKIIFFINAETTLIKIYVVTLTKK